MKIFDFFLKVYAVLILIGAFTAVFSFGISGVIVLACFIVLLFILGTNGFQGNLLAKHFPKAAVSIVAGIIVWGVVGFFNLETRPEVAVVDPRDETYWRIDSSEQGMDSILVHHRVWDDYDGASFQAKLGTKNKNFALAQDNHLGLEVDMRNGYPWSDIYGGLISHDTLLMSRIFNVLTHLQDSAKLNRVQFANVLVSMVQDIPYQLILVNDCANSSRSEIQELLDDGTPCKGGNRFGVRSPIEFVHTLAGDCDTRTVLLYSLLDRFGYDVVILGSSHYAHSILGLNLPGKGDFKWHLGKRYYLWETTAKSWTLGEISPSLNTMNKWEVELTSSINKQREV